MRLNRANTTAFALSHSPVTHLLRGSFTTAFQSPRCAPKPPSITPTPLRHSPTCVAASASSTPNTFPTWLDNSNCDILPPPTQRPDCIIVFVAGFGASLSPRNAYSGLLCALSKLLNARIIAHRTAVSADHLALSRKMAGDIGDAVRYVQRDGEGGVPVFGVSHSLGAKLLLLLCSDKIARDSLALVLQANVILAFNNASTNTALPLSPGMSSKAVDTIGKIGSFLKSFDVSMMDDPGADRTRDNIVEMLDGVSNVLGKEFVPSPEQSIALIGSRYSVSNNLVVQFDKDDLDDSSSVIPVLQARFGGSGALVRRLAGSHLTPMTPDLEGGFAGLGNEKLDYQVRNVAGNVGGELDKCVNNIVAFVRLQMQMVDRVNTPLDGGQDG